MKAAMPIMDRHSWALSRPRNPVGASCSEATARDKADSSGNDRRERHQTNVRPDATLSHLVRQR